MVKLDAASDYLDAVEAVTRAGIPVFAQFGITPQTALRYGVEYKSIPSAADAVPVELKDELVAEAKRLEDAGAALLNFTNSGPVVGAAVAEAVGDPRRRRVRRRAVARRPDAHGERGDRLRGLGDRRRAGHLRQRRPADAGGDDGATPTTSAPRGSCPGASPSRRRPDRPPADAVRTPERNATVPTAVVDGIPTRYEVTGDGPPLLMFSPGGFDSTLESWRTVGIYQRLNLLEHLDAALHLHHLRPARVGAVRRPGRADLVGRLRPAGPRAARRARRRVGAPDGRLRRVLGGGRDRRRAPRAGALDGAVLAGRRREVPDEAALPVRAAPGLRRRARARRGRGARPGVRRARSPRTRGSARGTACCAPTSRSPPRTPPATRPATG